MYRARLARHRGARFEATSFFATPRDWLRVGIMSRRGRVDGRQVLPAAGSGRYTPSQRTLSTAHDMLGFNTSVRSRHNKGSVATTIDEKRERAGDPFFFFSFFCLFVLASLFSLFLWFLFFFFWFFLSFSLLFSAFLL